LSRLTSAEIAQMEFGADTALFRIVLPRTMSSLRALEVRLEGSNYERLYDFEAMAEHPDCDHNDAVDGLELFAYPFNQGEYLYKRVWDRYEDGQIQWQYPASPDRGTGNFFPFLHEGLAKTPSYAIDLIVRDLPNGWDIANLNIRLIDIWGYGVEVNGVPQSMDEHFAWAMIDEENNDAEESQSGTMYLSSGDLDLGYNGSMKHQKVGLRFTDLGIPKNAGIMGGYVQFRAETSNATAVNLTVKAENSSNSALFAGGSKNITNRPTTTASVPWSPAAWTIDQMEDVQKTPALTPVVQEMVNRNDWTAASPMTFIIASVANHTGKRESEDFSSVSLWDNPYLYVLYNEPPQALVGPPDNDNKDSGLYHENSMTVSPNPTTDGFFSVKLNLETQTEIHISLLDMVGRQVAHATILPGEGEGVYFNVQGLAKGVYMVTAETDSGIFTKKIAVK
jgi:hypothetical protein